MKVLLSIKPEFVSKIFGGSKKYEYRRAIFKREGIKTVIVYASSPISKVVGEFEIGGILCYEPKRLWRETKQHAGISRKGFLDYFSSKRNGYAIKVKNSTLYEKPIALKKFKVATAPQSFRYLKNSKLN